MKTQNQTLYFAYGSNLHHGQMAARCPDSTRVLPALLLDHKLAFRGRGAYGVANVEPCAGSDVPGYLWFLPPADEETLDRYEGCPWLYEKRQTRVATEEGTMLALVYVMVPGLPLAPPSNAYLSCIREGYAQNKLEGPALLAAVKEAREAVRV